MDLKQTNDVHTNMFFVKVPWHWIIVEELSSWSRALCRFEGNSIKVKFDGIYKINTQRDWVSGNSILFFMCWAIIPNMEELQFLNATTHIGFELLLAEDYYIPDHYYTKNKHNNFIIRGRKFGKSGTYLNKMINVRWKLKSRKLVTMIKDSV